MNRQLFIVIGIIAVFLALVTGAVFAAQDIPLYTDSASPNWSRGQLIGYASLVNPIAMLPDSQGQTHLVWVTGKLPDSQQLQYTRLNAQGEVAESKPLALPQPRPETPTLFRDDDGALRLFYRAQAPNLNPLERALYYGRLRSDGNIVTTVQLSQPDLPVRTYSVSARKAPTPLFDVFYSGDGAVPAVHHLNFGADGESLASQSLSSTGTRPQAQLDAKGQIHLAWFERGVWDSSTGSNRAELYYGLPTTTTSLSLRLFKLIVFEYPSGVDLRPPQIALDRTHVYISWVQDKRGGKGDINSQLFYVSFLQGQPHIFAEPSQLKLLNTGRIQYESRPFESLTQLAPAQRDPASNYLKDWQWLTGQHDAAIGVGLVGLKDKQRGAVQVASLVMAQGQPAGYQLVNRSLAPSNQPSIALAANHALQAVWLDSADGERYAVRFATTEPQLVARWNRLSWRDVLTRSLNFLWYELSFLPFVVLSSVWLVFPLGFLIGKTIWSGEATLDSRSARVALLIAIVLHIGVKAAALPPPPSDWGLGLYGVFVAGLSAGGLAMMAWYLRRTRYPSLISAYAIFAAMDIALTLFVYLPIVNAS